MPCIELIYIDNTNVVELTALTNSAAKQHYYKIAVSDGTAGPKGVDPDIDYYLTTLGV
jgi:hypothetical protein